MIISFSASVTGINTLLSKKFAWKINDLSAENLLDPVLNYTESVSIVRPLFAFSLLCSEVSAVELCLVSGPSPIFSDFLLHWLEGSSRNALGIHAKLAA